MNYLQSLKYLDSFFNLEKIEINAANRNLNLKRMRHLLKIFDHPEKSFFPILIAGTKGKGSTGYFLEQILAAAHIPVGFFNSPHLESPLERIRVAGKTIAEKQWCQGLDDLKKGLSKRAWPKNLGRLTYFEITTLLAMLVFGKLKIKIAIFEVGLGGRLDATNVLNAPIAVITSIGLDHEAFLGNTISKIAGEKAGIIKQDSDVVVACQAPAALKVIVAKSKSMNARLHRYSPLRVKEVGLRGNFQKMNAACAVKAVRILKEKHGFLISKQAVVKGLAMNSWPGRFEQMNSHKGLYLDVAHNPSAMKAVMSTLKEHSENYKRKIAVFSVMRDKNSKEMLKSLSENFDEIILSQLDDSRAQSLDVLVRQAADFFKMTYVSKSTGDTLRLIKKIKSNEDFLFITGSFRLVGEMRKKLK